MIMAARHGTLHASHFTDSNSASLSRNTMKNKKIARISYLGQIRLWRNILAYTKAFML